MGAFSTTLTAIGAERCGRADTDVALVVPAQMDTAFPFTSPDDRTSAAKTLAQAYVSARLADLPPALSRESEGARLYLLPSVKQLLAPTPSVLERLARAGACVYLSYSAGENAWHRGPSYGRLNELFGVVHQLDLGLGDPIGDEVAELTLISDFGGLTNGTTLRFRVAGSVTVRSFGVMVLVFDDHSAGQRADALDRDRDLVPRGQRPGTVRGRPGQQHVAREQRHHVADVRDQPRHVPG